MRGGSGAREERAHGPAAVLGETTRAGRTRAKAPGRRVWCAKGDGTAGAEETGQREKRSWGLPHECGSQWSSPGSSHPSGP